MMKKLVALFFALFILTSALAKGKEGQILEKGAFITYLKLFLEKAKEAVEAGKASIYDTYEELEVFDSALGTFRIYHQPRKIRFLTSRANAFKQDIKLAIDQLDSKGRVEKQDKDLFFTTKRLAASWVFALDSAEFRVEVVPEEFDLRPEFVMEKISFLDKTINSSILSMKIDSIEDRRVVFFPFFISPETSLNNKKIAFRHENNKFTLLMHPETIGYHLQVKDGVTHQDIPSTTIEVKYGKNPIPVPRTDDGVMVSIVKRLPYIFIASHPDYITRSGKLEYTGTKDSTVIFLYPAAKKLTLRFGISRSYRNANYVQKLAKIDTSITVTQYPYIPDNEILPTSLKGYWNVNSCLIDSRAVTDTMILLTRLTENVTKSIQITTPKECKIKIVGFQSEDDKEIQVQHSGQVMLSYIYPVNPLPGDQFKIVVTKPSGYNIRINGQDETDESQDLLTLGYNDLGRVSSLEFYPMKAFHLVYVASVDVEWRNLDSLTNGVRRIVSNLPDQDESILFVSDRNHPIISRNESMRRAISNLPSDYVFPIYSNDFDRFREYIPDFRRYVNSRKMVYFNLFLTRSTFSYYQHNLEKFINLFGEHLNVSVKCYTNFDVDPTVRFGNRVVRCQNVFR